MYLAHDAKSCLIKVRAFPFYSVCNLVHQREICQSDPHCHFDEYVISHLDVQ